MLFHLFSDFLPSKPWAKNSPKKNLTDDFPRRFVRRFFSPPVSGLAHVARVCRGAVAVFGLDDLMGIRWEFNFRCFFISLFFLETVFVLEMVSQIQSCSLLFRFRYFIIRPGSSKYFQNPFLNIHYFSLSFIGAYTHICIHASTIVQFFSLDFGLVTILKGTRMIFYSWDVCAPHFHGILLIFWVQATATTAFSTKKLSPHNFI